MKRQTLSSLHLHSFICVIRSKSKHEPVVLLYLVTNQQLQQKNILVFISFEEGMYTSLMAQL